MLTNIKSKALAIVFTIVMLISAIIGFGAMKGNAQADVSETPTLTIKTNNVSYDDSVYILYAVNCSGFDSSKYQVKMLFWTELQEEYTVNTVKYTETDKGSSNIGGENCLIFYSQGIAAKKMTDDIYASAYVEINGIKYYSEKTKFSVLEYVYEMRDKDKDDDDSNDLSDNQREMFDSMLAYGGAAQKLFNYKTDRLANDTYYSVRVYGGKLSDGFDHGRYKNGDVLNLTADKPAEDKCFSHWVDKSGNTVGTDEEIEIEVGDSDERYEAIYKDIEDLGTEGLTYKIVDDHAEVTGYTGTSTEVVIAKTYEGLSVTSIGEKAFYKCSSLTSITIPDGVKSIGAFAFYECSSLTSITIPYEVTEIWNDAFGKCSALTSIVIGKGVTSIGVDAFRNCSKLTTVYYGGNEEEWTALQENIESNNTCLTDATIYYYSETRPTTEGNYWHYDEDNNIVIWSLASTGLAYSVLSETDKTCKITGIGTCTDTDLIIPSSIDGYTVTEIGERAFEYNTAITSVVIPDSVIRIEGYYAFRNCGSLTSVTIGKGVTSIGPSAFYNCSSLINVTIQENVISIGSWVFYKCSSLESITIPDSVTSIGNGTFSDCGSLANVQISNKVTSIGNYVFNNCSSLTSITIPESVTSIGEQAFFKCSSLTSITIPEGVTSIGEQAFRYCSLLTRVTIPNSVESIVGYTFEGCTSLTSVTLGNNVTSIGDFAFASCTLMSSITIPESVTSIERYAFYDCTSLISIIIPNRVMSIGTAAFQDCKSLESVTILNDETNIGEQAFRCCRSLTNVTIPKGTRSIGGYMFYECVSLTSITIPDSVTSMEKTAFYCCNALEKIYYTGDINDWVEINGISNLTSEGKFNKNLYINDGLVTEVNITTATNINAYAFCRCSSVTSVTIGKGVTSIGDYAISFCNSLASVVFDDTDGWYVTESSSDWENKMGGTLVDVTDSSTNATYLTDTYKNYYWYKA